MQSQGNNTIILFQSFSSLLNSISLWIYLLSLIHILNRIYDRYQIPLFISENGIGAIDQQETDGSIIDDYRIDYLKNHIKALKDAIEIDYVDCFGYAMWGPIDMILSLIPI